MRRILFALLFSYATYGADYRTNWQSCYGFGRVASVETMDGSCLGLVVNKKDIGWKMPRKLLFVNESELFVTTMGGWGKNKGQVWRFKFDGARIVEKKVIFDRTDRSHGIALGPDGMVYIGDATQIFRFDPNRENPSKEVVISNLPDSYRHRGQTINSNHPLTEFIFLPSGDLLINVGAPSDDCSEEYRSIGVCRQRDEQADLRLYKYDPSQGTYSSRYTRVAYGLRNSMGLAYNSHTGEVYQVENAQDGRNTPDEFNVIELGQVEDFGWPFCSGMGERYRGYSRFRTFCESRAKKPLFLLPAHASPLDLMYYNGDMFPRLTGSLLVSYHGHRPTGSRIAAYQTDSLGRPILHNVSPFDLPEFIVDHWQRDPGHLHPKGRPVGLATDKKGAIWIIDDQNGALLVLADSSEGASPPGGDIDLDIWSTDRVDQEFSAQQLDLWSEASNSLAELNCAACHSDIITNDESETLANMLNAGWLQLGRESGGQLLWERMRGENSRMMPPPPAEPMSDHQADTISRFLLHIE